MPFTVPIHEAQILIYTDWRTYERIWQVQACFSYAPIKV
jgi:hypothetical protein